MTHYYEVFTEYKSYGDYAAPTHRFITETELDKDEYEEQFIKNSMGCEGCTVLREATKEEYDREVAWNKQRAEQIRMSRLRRW